MTHLIIPMAGRGSRFLNEKLPKPLIEINSKPFFYWSAMSIFKFIKVKSIKFVVLREHVEDFFIDKFIFKYFPNASIVIIDDVTPGAVFTGLEGIKEIHDDSPVIFNDCDHLFKSSELINYCNNYNELNELNELYDAALVTFNSDKDKYSYLRINSLGEVVETKEKKVISNYAICGCYLFKNTTLFRKHAQEYIDDCEYDEFFMSGVYNKLINNNKKIANFITDFHLNFGDPDEYEDAKKSNKFDYLA